MYNDFKVANYSKALLSPELYARHLSRLFSGDVADGLTVAPGIGLQVVLAPGNALLRYGSANVASARLVSLVASFNLTIGTPDVSNPRIDAVVVYVDNSVTLPSGTPGSANLDGLGVAKAKIVPGTPGSSPVVANNTAIQASVGAGNPYTVVAQVRVDTGVSVIAANKITDTRSLTRPLNASSSTWWEEIARTTLTAPAATLSIADIPKRKYLRIVLTLFSTAPNYNISAALRFNSDTANNYARRSSDNYGGASPTLTSQNSFSLTSPTTINSLSTTIDVLNSSAYEKMITGSENLNVGNGPLNAHVVAEFSGKWANVSSMLERLDVLNAGTSQYGIGSEVIVLGHD